MTAESSKMERKAFISQAMEDYLKAIYELSDSDTTVSTSRIAKFMKRTPASVTNMLQKLSSFKLVDYAPYHGVKLNTAGRKVALEVIRHHRLLELYLSEFLGYSWDRVHEEADQLEHVISEEFEARIDKILGYPKIDPHGAPIPSPDGQIPRRDLSCLWNIKTGERVIIRSVSDRNPEVLRYLAGLEIYPDLEVQIMGRDPFNGPIHLEFDKKEHSLSEQLARQIWVEVKH